MPSYAVLGATGNIGQALIQILLHSPTRKVHAYCRSKQKLHGLAPEMAHNKQVQEFEGNLQDTELLANCLRGTSAAFLAIAPPGNQPGCTVVQDVARSVISALERLQLENERLPKLILVSSASTEHRLMSHVSSYLLAILYTAFSNTYDDLKEAEAFLRTHESLTSMIFVKPGALSNDTQKGHSLSTESAQSPVSFLDLAAGMVEVADDESGRYDLKSVAVNATAKDVAFPREAPLKLFRGLLSHFLPWTYQYIG